MSKVDRVDRGVSTADDTYSTEHWTQCSYGGYPNLPDNNELLEDGKDVKFRCGRRSVLPTCAASGCLGSKEDPTNCPPSTSLQQRERGTNDETLLCAGSSVVERPSVVIPATNCSKTVRERNVSMLYSDVMADVWFVVGVPGTQSQQCIPAHTYVLATGSSVFYAMFYGAFPRSSQIVIPDVDPNAFKILLRYLYTDEVLLDDDNVLPTLYASKKYLVNYLTAECIRFLDRSLTASNVCLFLSQSRLFEENELMQKCWDVIDAQATAALSSVGFLEINIETLESIFRRETLNIEEVKIFEAAMRWAEAECARRQLDPEIASNKRAVLGLAFDLIRFPVMKCEEFANGPAQSGLLDTRETVDVFLYHFSTTKPELRFPCEPRKGLLLRRCLRFESSAYRTNQWRYRGRCDSIQFCTDRRVFIAGFGLYGSSSGAAEYKSTIELKKASTVLTRISSSFFSDGSSNTFPILFDQPVQTEPDVFYTVSAVLDGTELSYFGQDGMQEVQSGNVTFQFRCSNESTNGTGVQGGQIPEILFYS